MSAIAALRRPGRRAGSRLRRPLRDPLRDPMPAAKPIRPGEVEETIAVASSAFTVIAVICAWMLLQLLVLGGLSAQRSQDLLYGEFRKELAAGTAPTGALDYQGKPLEPGSPVALLSIPQLDLEQVVVDGTASGDLRAGPGHLRSTPLPGQAGVSVVMGRASSYGAPFRDLDRLAPGDAITVRNAEGEVTYQVRSVRRAGDPVPTAPTGSGGLLTLVSAEGSGALSALRPGQVLYVDAVTEKALPAGPVAAAVPASERVMARDTSALPVLVLLLAGVLALVLAVSTARRRFPAPLVWVLATPLAIALAWSATDEVARLLPNLM
ncbi:class E sortase [Nocardioides sp. CER19]|uniref:sortase n=1 Tax=Nocardioides sp. CER19 TaxID=3038538 RepID=UPI00244B8669|nr:class E sortase [Nocardioides sp. CER19]MDH2414843.1 class E sortase [Nocardioides sp. CER19]